MKLYYFPGSTTCRPVQMFAAEAGIPLTLEAVDLMQGAHMAPDYKTINPARQVPVIEEEDGFRLAESSAILKYLADKVGATRTYPTDLRARAKVNALMDWINTSLYRELGYHYVYPQILPFMAFEDAAAQTATLARGAAGTERALRTLNDDLLADAAGPFLGGAEPNLADYLGVAFVTIAEMVAHDLATYPRVARWVAAMRARPCWKDANAPWEGWRDHCLSQRSAAATA
jgi:glutathione S-transferase